MTFKTSTTNTQIRPEREWTVDTLKAYVDAVNTQADRRYEEMFAASGESRRDADRRYEVRFEAQEKAVNAALTAAKEAVAKAEIAAEKRFDSVNEFRAQLSDQAATFMPRTESEQRIGQLAEKIAELQHRIDKSEGRSGGISTSWAALFATGGLIVAALSIVLRFLVPA